MAMNVWVMVGIIVIDYRNPRKIVLGKMRLLCHYSTLSVQIIGHYLYHNKFVLRNKPEPHRVVRIMNIYLVG